jgi:hypothetical protein
MTDMMKERVRAAEFLLRPESNQPQQLIDGEIIDMGSPVPSHQKTVYTTARVLEPLVLKLGRQFHAHHRHDLRARHKADARLFIARVHDLEIGEQHRSGRVCADVAQRMDAFSIYKRRADLDNIDIWVNLREDGEAARQVAIERKLKLGRHALSRYFQRTSA